MEVNGQGFENMQHANALEILRSNCHLAITVKSNLLGKCTKKLFVTNSFHINSILKKLNEYFNAKFLVTN